MVEARRASHMSLPTISYIFFLSMYLICVSASAKQLLRTEEGEACPSRTPESFFGAFTKDVGIQSAFTRFPIRYGFLVGGATYKSVKINRAEDLPFLSLTNGRIAENPGDAHKDLYLELQEKDKDFFLIAIGSMSNKYYLKYSFEFKNNCWYLREVSNMEDVRER